MDLREPQVFQQGSLRAIVDPRRLEYGVPVRSDLLVLQLLKDNYGVRPFYIARTTGGYVQALGLEPYALMQGLANKILTAPAPSNRDTVPVGGLGHVDLRRSLDLWRSYGGPAAIIARGDWVDRPSVGIPYLYVATGLMLSEVLNATNQPAEADRVLAQTRQIARAVQLTDLLAQLEQPAQPLPESNPLLVPRGDTQRGQSVPDRP